MLILTRRPTESLHIDDQVVITVLGIRGQQVRLGITAPKDVVVDRTEVHQRKLLEFRSADKQSVPCDAGSLPTLCAIPVPVSECSMDALAEREQGAPPQNC